MKRTMIAAAIITPLVIALVVAYWMRRTLIPMIDSTRYLWPVPGHTRITSRFGHRHAPTQGASTDHNGIDIGAPKGADIVSPWDGVVRSVFSTTGGGNQLVIDHADGRVTGYAHLSQTLVQVGDRVTRGQVIAKVGATGRVTGPHLHFTLRPSREGAHVDPETLYA